MAYFHGVRITESPTPLQVPVAVDSAMPIFIGVAPVHRLENPELAVNNPALATSFQEGVADMSYIEPKHWKKFPLSMALYSQFRMHAVSPAVLINVWDPTAAANQQAVTEIDLPIVNRVATIENEMAMISTVEVHNVTTGDDPYVRNEDYTLKYDGDKLLITVLEDGDIPAGTLALTVTYMEAIVSTVTAANIIGGIDPDTNKRTGIELVDQVFQHLRKIPAFLVAPWWSYTPDVASLLISKATNLEYDFSCIALLDSPTRTGSGTQNFSNYRNIPLWKNSNSIISPNAFLEWPCVGNGEEQVYAPSVRLAGMYGEVDAKNGGLPYEQASNKILSMTHLCDEDGNTIQMLSESQANFLNENGIGTFINFDGWRAWGTETTAFPGNTDIKDFDRGVRRMFCYVQNVINRTMRQNLDRPITRLLIDTVLLTGNEYINTLMARKALLGGEVQFLRADNSDQGILSGLLYFRVLMTPPNAAKVLEFNFSYDTNNLGSLF